MFCLLCRNGLVGGGSRVEARRLVTRLALIQMRIDGDLGWSDVRRAAEK